jgi:hypothetical protein
MYENRTMKSLKIIQKRVLVQLICINKKRTKCGSVKREQNVGQYVGEK